MSARANLGLGIGLLLQYLVVMAVFSQVGLAGVRVSPTELIMASSSRSSAITVTNPGLIDQEVWIEFRYGYEVPSENGLPGLYFPDTESGLEPSASSWLRAFPQRVIIPAAGMQVIRITATPAAGTPEGEYWTRVVVASKNLKESPFLSKPATLPGAGFLMVQKISIPFHYRKGKLQTGITVTRVVAESTPDSILFRADLNRQGNAAFWGTVMLRLKGGAGTSLVAQRKNLLVYKSGTYYFWLRRPSAPPGTYDVEFEFNIRDRDRDPPSSISFEPVRYSTTITLQ